MGSWLEKLVNEEGGEKMPLELPSAIRLEEAYFCLNCEVITNCLDICPTCGHEQLWSLENWLGRVNGRENGRTGEDIVAKNENLSRALSG